MLMLKIDTFKTIADQLDALLQSETHYLENHQFDSAVRLLPEKKRLIREYHKCCDSLADDHTFSTLETAQKVAIKNLARKLHTQIQDNQSALEMAIQYTETVMDIFKQTKLQVAEKNNYMRNAKYNIKTTPIGVAQTV